MSPLLLVLLAVSPPNAAADVNAQLRSCVETHNDWVTSMGSRSPSDEPSAACRALIQRNQRLLERGECSQHLATACRYRINGTDVVGTGAVVQPATHGNCIQEWNQHAGCPEDKLPERCRALMQPLIQAGRIVRDGGACRLGTAAEGSQAQCLASMDSREKCETQPVPTSGPCTGVTLPGRMWRENKCQERGSAASTCQPIEAALRRFATAGQESSVAHQTSVSGTTACAEINALRTTLERRRQIAGQCESLRSGAIVPNAAEIRDDCQRWHEADVAARAREAGLTAQLCRQYQQRAPNPPLTTERRRLCGELLERGQAVTREQAIATAQAECDRATSAEPNTALHRRRETLCAHVTELRRLARDNTTIGRDLASQSILATLRDRYSRTPQDMASLGNYISVPENRRAFEAACGGERVANQRCASFIDQAVTRSRAQIALDAHFRGDTAGAISPANRRLYSDYVSRLPDRDRQRFLAQIDGCTDALGETARPCVDGVLSSWRTGMNRGANAVVNRQVCGEANAGRNPELFALCRTQGHIQMQPTYRGRIDNGVGQPSFVGNRPTQTRATQAAPAEWCWWFIFPYRCHAGTRTAVWNPQPQNRWRDPEFGR